MPNSFRTIEYAKADRTYGQAMWQMERAGIAQQASRQLQTPKHILGIPLDVFKMCRDEITGESPEDYIGAMQHRIDIGESFAAVARDERRGTVEAMLEVSLQRRGVPFYEVAALYGRTLSASKDFTEAVLGGLLTYFSELYDDRYPIYASVLGWRKTCERSLHNQMHRVYESNGFNDVMPDAHHKILGGLKITRMVNQRGRVI